MLSKESSSTATGPTSHQILPTDRTEVDMQNLPGMLTQPRAAAHGAGKACQLNSNWLLWVVPLVLEQFSSWHFTGKLVGEKA